MPEHTHNDEGHLEDHKWAVKAHGTGLIHSQIVLPWKRLENRQAQIKASLEIRLIHKAELGLNKAEDVVVRILTG